MNQNQKKPKKKKMFSHPRLIKRQKQSSRPPIRKRRNEKQPQLIKLMQRPSGRMAITQPIVPQPVQRQVSISQPVQRQVSFTQPNVSSQSRFLDIFKSDEDKKKEELEIKKTEDDKTKKFVIIGASVVGLGIIIYVVSSKKRSKK